MLKDSSDSLVEYSPNVWKTLDSVVSTIKNNKQIKKPLSLDLVFSY